MKHHGSRLLVVTILVASFFIILVHFKPDGFLSQQHQEETNLLALVPGAASRVPAAQLKSGRARGPRGAVDGIVQATGDKRVPKRPKPQHSATTDRSESSGKSDPI